MKVYLCMNQAGLVELGDRYFQHLAVSVHSCVRMTDLEPCLIYDGGMSDYIRKIEGLGCEIIRHELSFKNDLRRVCKESAVNFDVAAGAFLRLDIPLINRDDQYALYVDVDVMFLRQPDFSDCTPGIFAAAPEQQIDNYAHVNSGVLLINVPGLRAELPGLVDRIIGGGLKTPSGDLNDYFRGRMDRLSPVYNWKPYWGENDEACIVHWHGVKYPAAKAISLGREKEITAHHPHPEIYQRNPSGYISYLRKFEDFLAAMPISVGGTMPEPSSARACEASGVVGPGHVIRWNFHVRDKVVRAAVPPARMVGIGGAPVWSKFIFDAAGRIVAEGGTVGLMVGDFRFGNGVGLKAEHEPASLFEDGYLGIAPEAMTLELDRRMLERGLAAVKAWHETFGGKVRFVFWDLFGKQVHDRLAGWHIGEGRYRHPVFNYAETVAQFPDAGIVDLSPLLRSPMHEVRRLFIDTSSHPSQIGYLFLDEALCRARDVTEAYGEAVDEVEAALFALARKLAAAKAGPVLLTGRSVWLDTLVGYMGMSGAVRLAQAGLVLAPLDRAPGQPGIERMLQEVPLELCTPVVVSAQGRDLSSQLARAFGTPFSFWRDVPCIDWEAATIPVITARGETPRHARAGGDGIRAANVITPDLAAHMVELGPLGMPSWSGLCHILDCIARPDAVPDRRARPEEGARPPAPPSIRGIEGDALLTDAGIAFLIGGNHAVLKFATGELTPSVRSFESFCANIAARRKLAEASGARYAHVIFPDKQSVLSEAFPYQPVHRLGDAYVARLPAAEKAFVLYPVEPLRGETVPTFLPLDTHMTDHGSLVVLRLMLAALGINADDTLDHVASRITRRQRWAGDLGAKFTPPLLQDGIVLDPDWEITELRSPGGFNDGTIDLLFNPKAAIDGTVLLFGDSFFRMMLQQMSAVFGKVVHLRSRFLHPEMVTLIAPDFVVTGNAERYLADVAADREAPAFALIPALRGIPAPTADSPFLAGWRSVTAPEATSSRTYFDALGFASKDAAAAVPPAEVRIVAPHRAPAGLRVLIATHHLLRFGGSELVAIELAEEFRNRGCIVSVFSPFADIDFLKPLLEPGIDVLTKAGAVDLTRYDLVYSHHQALSQVLADQKGVFPFEGPVPLFVYNHLSPFEQMEFPGPFIEAQMADLILCNSPETMSRLAAFGPPFDDAVLFRNPAPAAFEAATDAGQPHQLKRLLSVSSHLPRELEQAFSLLDDGGIAVTRIGHPAHERRVTPADLRATDAVITIGKTVQYALRNRRPVYCYDHVGGPGWLVERTFEDAARTNFSGRSQPQRRDPEAIAHELVAGFSAAAEFTARLPGDRLAPFRLESCVDELLGRLLPAVGRRHPIQDASADERARCRVQWEREGEIYRLLDRHFGSRLPNKGFAA